MRNINIFNNNQLYGQIRDGDLYVIDPSGHLKLANDQWCIFEDLLPEGIDLKIMQHMCQTQESRKLLSFLKNTIGSFTFESKHDHILLSDPLPTSWNFPNILNYKVHIALPQLTPKIDTPIAQRLSLSGCQHKLQVYLKEGALIDQYSNLILKPANSSISPFIALNEHMHTSFLKELGFEVPCNGIVWDERLKAHHYLIQRFDITPQGHKIEQISLNSLMGDISDHKYQGTIETCAKFLQTLLDDFNKQLFVRYVYANALLFNGDLHRKNISFIRDGKNPWQLSPAYDIINTNLLNKEYSVSQCCLPINGRINKIRLQDFKQTINILQLNQEEMLGQLESLYHTYKEKYPTYIERVKNSWLRQKAFETFDRNVRIQENIKTNSIQNRRRQKQNPPEHDKTDGFEML